MGSSNSRIGSHPPRRTGSHQRRWPKLKHTISSLLVCGAPSSSSRSRNEMEGYPADLLVNSAEHGHKKKLKLPRNDSDVSLSSISTKTENGASSGRCITSREGVGLSNIDPGVNRRKCLSESRELIPNLGGTEAASTSYLNQPYQPRVSANEMASIDSLNRIYINNNVESLLDEVSVENNVSETIDFDSIMDSNSLRGDSLQEVDVVGISSNNSADISFVDDEVRRNSRRLFWDAFSSRRGTESRTFVFSPEENTDHMRSQDRWLLDFSGDFFISESSRASSTQSRSNEPRSDSRTEVWERLHGGLDSTYHQATACPMGIHTNGSCLCQSSLLPEESGTRGGISRIVMLAEALFEVLDQIHRQPMSLSMSVVSLPAPEWVVDSFPLKTYSKTETLELANDISQCYICLSEYEEGEKIRVLPCHHEYHMSCVDRWLKEIHGVCPLCRGDVRDSLSDSSVSS